jgi:hypothetical protein
LVHVFNGIFHNNYLEYGIRNNPSTGRKIIYLNWKKIKKQNQQSSIESLFNKLIVFVENPWIIAKLKNSHRFSKFLLKEECVEIALHAIQY